MTDRIKQLPKTMCTFILAALLSVGSADARVSNLQGSSNVLVWTKARTKSGCTYKFPSKWKLTTWFDAQAGNETIAIREFAGNRLPFGLSKEFSLYISVHTESNQSGDILFLPKIGPNEDGYTSTHWASKAESGDHEQVLIIGSQTPETTTVNSPSMTVTRYEPKLKITYGLRTGLDVRSYLLMRHLGWDYGVRVAEPEYFVVFDSIDCSGVNFKE